MAISSDMKVGRWGAALLLLSLIAPVYANGVTCTTDVGSFGHGGSYLNSVNVAGQPFLDAYCFALSEPVSIVNVGVQNNVISNPPILDYDITDLNLEMFWQQPDGTWQSLGSGLSMSYAFRGAPIGLLAAVSGNAAGGNGGLYSFGFAVSAVPIPGALILFASGLLGVAGTSLRHRRRS